MFWTKMTRQTCKFRHNKAELVEFFQPQLSMENRTLTKIIIEYLELKLLPLPPKNKCANL